MRHILVCLAGMTPQVITETLYVLMVQQQEQVDEVRVITTIAGKNMVMRQLLDPQIGKFYEFCREYSIDSSSILFSEKTILLLTSSEIMTLEDIRTVEDNQAAANYICNFISRLTEDSNTRIHASVAGGRKTMGIYLTAAMQLFGRVQDKISHVLVSEDFEQHPDFYYIPKKPRLLEIKDKGGNLIKTVSTANAKIHLAEIPFIRMRGILTNWLETIAKGYNEFVKRAQDDLDLFESSHDLNINFRKKSVTIGGRTATLTERELFIYALLANQCKAGAGEKGYLKVSEIKESDIRQLLRLITRSRGDEQDVDDLSNSRFTFVKDMLRELRNTDKSNRESLRETFSQVIAKIKRKFQDSNMPEKCFPASLGARGVPVYGLRFPPERINLE